jgi:hypothetical protein
VSIDRFFHPTDAHIAAGRLISEGIPVNLIGIHHASAHWLMTTALGGIHLQVPAESADAARAILASVAATEDVEASRCPKCGALDTSAHTNTWKLAFLSVHLFGIPLPWGRSRRKCNACSAEWSER